MKNSTWKVQRPIALVGIGLSLMAIACRTTDPVAIQQAKNAKQPTPTSTQSLGTSIDSGVVRTDFRPTVKPDEEVKVHLDLARMYELRGGGDAAIYEYQRAIDVSESQGHHLTQASPELAALAHRRMAAVLDRSGRFAQAEVHYKKALEINPKDPKVWNDAGYSAYLQQRWAEAEGRLKTAAKLDPLDTRIQTNLGLCLAAAGKTGEALDALSRAGGPAVGHANLGYLLAALGKHDEARAHYQQALALQPKLEAARAALAQLEVQASAGSGAALTSRSTPADRQITRAAVTAPPPVAIGTAAQATEIRAPLVQPSHVEPSTLAKRLFRRR